MPRHKAVASVRFHTGNISLDWSVYIAEGNEVVEMRLASKGAKPASGCKRACEGFLNHTS
jgi:hypothetical protein